MDGEDDNEVNNMDFDNLNHSPRQLPGHPISPPSTNPNTNSMPHPHERPQVLPSYVNPQSLSHSPTVSGHNGTSHSQHSHVPHANAPSAVSSSTLVSSSTPSLGASQPNHQPRTSLPIQTPVPTISTPQISPSTSVSTSAPASDSTPINVTLTQGMINAYLQFLQVQTQTSKMKLEYMRRREEREEAESTRRREMERMKMERETQQLEHDKITALTKQRTDRAIVSVSCMIQCSVTQLCIIIRRFSATRT